jgi:hypothetical protein
MTELNSSLNCFDSLSEINLNNTSMDFSKKNNNSFYSMNNDGEKSTNLIQQTVPSHANHEIHRSQSERKVELEAVRLLLEKTSQNIKSIDSLINRASVSKSPSVEKDKEKPTFNIKNIKTIETEENLASTPITPSRSKFNSNNEVNLLSSIVKKTVDNIKEVDRKVSVSSHSSTSNVNNTQNTSPINRNPLAETKSSNLSHKNLNSQHNINLTSPGSIKRNFAIIEERDEDLFSRNSNMKYEPVSKRGELDLKKSNFKHGVLNKTVNLNKFIDNTSSVIPASKRHMSGVQNLDHLREMKQPLEQKLKIKKDELKDNYVSSVRSSINTPKNMIASKNLEKTQTKKLIKEDRKSPLTTTKNILTKKKTISGSNFLTESAYNTINAGKKDNPLMTVHIAHKKAPSISYMSEHTANLNKVKSKKQLSSLSERVKLPLNSGLAKNASIKKSNTNLLMPNSKIKKKCNCNCHSNSTPNLPKRNSTIMNKVKKNEINVSKIASIEELVKEPSKIRMYKELFTLFNDILSTLYDENIDINTWKPNFNNIGENYQICEEDKQNISFFSLNNYNKDNNVLTTNVNSSGINLSIDTKKSELNKRREERKSSNIMLIQRKWREYKLKKICGINLDFSKSKDSHFKVLKSNIYMNTFNTVEKFSNLLSLLNFSNEIYRNSTDIKGI